jgi:N-acetyl-gamma-glutamyl-phosphate reductase
MIRAGIVGVSGYSGKAVLDILLRHPNVRITYAGANNSQGALEEIWPDLRSRTKLLCEKFDVQKASQLCDVIFLALPHTESMNCAEKFLKAGKRVIDLSADYRLRKASEYKAWYGVEHKNPKLLSKAVYGLPELFRERIKGAQLIANPGCYPTAAILGLTPLVATGREEIESIIVDAKSGVSGAGRKTTSGLMFSEVNENFKAYKVLTHQHEPEINQCLSKIASLPVNVSFVAHLLPNNHGILETIYVRLKSPMSLNDVHTLYRKFYKTEHFVRVLPVGAQPETKNVVGTNFCDIGLAVSQDKQLIVVTSAIDNLIKGAAGQAVQNMNIMYGFKETEGLL